MSFLALLEAVAAELKRRDCKKNDNPTLRPMKMGDKIKVLYTILTPGQPNKRKWFKGVITRIGQATRTYKKVNIAFEDGEHVRGFNLHYHMYRSRGEAAWRMD